MLTQLLLARFGKRSYVEYKICRSKRLFQTRAKLLDYEEALREEEEFRKMMEGREYGQARAYVNGKALLRWGQALAEASEPSEEEEEEDTVNPFLRRYSTGWIYTRIIQQGVCVLGKLKDYGDEVLLLKMLLEQWHFCSHRRGEWYRRLALVQDVHLSQGEQAMATCVMALEEGVPLMDRWELEKRLAKLEVVHRIPKAKRYLNRHGVLSLSDGPVEVIQGRLGEREGV